MSRKVRNAQLRSNWAVNRITTIVAGNAQSASIAFVAAQKQITAYLDALNKLSQTFKDVTITLTKDKDKP